MKRQLNKHNLCILFAAWILLFFGLTSQAQRKLGVRPTPSGGDLSVEQASYDVLAYELDLRVNPEGQSIAGTAVTEARIVQPLRWLVLDLDMPLSVSQADWLNGPTGQQSLHQERRGSQIWVAFPSLRQPGETVRVRLAYGGRPRVAPHPPWVGGLVWEQTASGAPWVAVACQVDGADLWWPNKDHSSDEPERMDLRITVPAGLTAASNGTLRGVSENADGTATFHWRVDNPINAYNVSLNIAPYRTISGTYTSVTGETVPVTYWVLPENYEKGLELFPQFFEHLKFLEELIGPYPFRHEKYGVAEVPYLGMEHQTIIAYGANYENNPFGFDGLHFHELGHEWWGNLVTVTDWREYWIHEGFTSYMDALYAEHLGGAEAMKRFTSGLRGRLRNADPVAPRETRSTVAKYFVPPDYTETDGDVNFKGALILHTLRWLIGDAKFRASLREFAYPMGPPDKGCGCRFVDTDEFLHVVERLAGIELDWFSEVYLRQAKLPALHAEARGETLVLRWRVPQGLEFPMPVDVRIGEELRRVEMPGGRAEIQLPDGFEFEIDPGGWVLRER